MESPFLTRIITKAEKNRAIVALLVLLVVALIAATAYRVHDKYSVPSNKFQWGTSGHSDFHCGVYYPAVAYREGHNPYASAMMDEFPVSSPARTCPPIGFVVHLPFSYLTLEQADVAFFIFNTGLLFLLSFFTVAVTRGSPSPFWWMAVMIVVLVSRPGHITLFTGYYTAELVLGTLIALHFAKDRPWLSGFGMLLASTKPTYVLPLIILLLARRNFKAVVTGLIICTVAGVGGLAWIAKDIGVSELIAGIVEGQAVFHGEPTEFPENTWTRVDLVGMISKAIKACPGDSIYLAGMVAFLVIPCLAIWKISKPNQRGETNQGVAGLTGTIAILTIILSIYHHSYDCLLAIVPWVGLTFFPTQTLPEVGRKSRLSLAVLLGVPLINYASTLTFRDSFGIAQDSTAWLLITLLNGICLFIALIILLSIAFKLSSQSDSTLPAQPQLP